MKGAMMEIQDIKAGNPSRPPPSVVSDKGGTTPSPILVDIYRRMALIMRNDERFRSVIRSGRLIMPYYSTRGQEVIPSAMCVNLGAQDYICTIYRGIHDSLAKGVPMKL